MNLIDIKILKIGITDWLIKAIYSAKQHPSIIDNIWKLNDDKSIVEFELKHEDFDFFIDFNIYEPFKGACDVEFKNYSHVSDIYPDTDMIDFDDNRLEEIYKAVLWHF